MINNRYWVGERVNSRLLMLFDCSLLHSDSNMVYLYSSKNRTLEVHEKNFSRKILRTVQDERALALIFEFELWFCQHGADFLAKEQIKYKDRKIEIDKWRDQKNLDDVSAFKKKRSTNCYACKANLISGYHKQCNSCGWLVCTCGRCGC